MTRTNGILVGALIGTMLAPPVLAAAADKDCLQHNRMVSWRAVDENTLVFTDRQMKEYTVEMKNRCEGVTMGGAMLVYETWENLACLDSGVIIHVVAPGLVRGTCSIASVHAGAPDKAPG
jgi:hypothetical protein